MTGTGTYLRKLRLESGKSLNEIAAYLDVDPALPDKFERGDRYPDKNYLFQLAGCFGVNENDLLIACQTDRLLNETRRSGVTAVKRAENLEGELSRLLEKPVQVKTSKPPRHLQPYIESFHYCKNHHLDYKYETVIPDGTVQLVVELSGQERQVYTDQGKQEYLFKKAWVSGVQKQPLCYRSGRKKPVFCIRFRPGGFYALTNMPQTDLDSIPVEADAILGPAILQLHENLLSCRSITDMFTVAGEYFTDAFSPAGKVHPLATYLFRNSDTPLEELTRKSGYSRKHLIHVFKQQAGYTPKYYQRIRRFNKVLLDLQTNPKAKNWTALAYDHQFSDQAHFIKEFRHFSGITPVEFLVSGSTCPRFMFSDERR